MLSVFGRLDILETSVHYTVRTSCGQVYMYTVRIVASSRSNTVHNCIVLLWSFGHPADKCTCTQLASWLLHDQARSTIGTIGRLEILQTVTTLLCWLSTAVCKQKIKKILITNYQTWNYAAKQMYMYMYVPTCTSYRGLFTTKHRPRLDMLQTVPTLLLWHQQRSVNRYRTTMIN